MIQRKFILGDEWLYYKLYCGNRTSDSILTKTIKPLTEKLLTNNLITQWFFIRYEEPYPHLRIRFHCKRKDVIGLIIEEVKETIQNYVFDDIIWKVEIDTYQREIERYGVETMLVSETLFYIDSYTCVKALELINDDNLLFLFSLRSIDNILEVFSFSSEEKLSFAKENLNLFKLEFNSDKTLNKKLNKKYQDLKEQLVEFLDSQSHKQYQLLIDLLNIKNSTLLKLKHEYFNQEILNKTDMEELLSSYIHTMINRFFRSKHRLHELVCYDFLFKYYNFKLATKLIE